MWAEADNFIRQMGRAFCTCCTSYRSWNPNVNNTRNEGQRFQRRLCNPRTFLRMCILWPAASKWCGRSCVCVSMSINSELLQLRAFDAPNPSFSPKRDGEPSAWPIRSFSLLPAADVSNLLFYFCIFSASGAAGDFSPRSLQDSNPIKLKHFAHLFPSARLVLSRPPAA